MYKINHANIKEWAKNYNGEPFDAILCDPPYELGFMGKSWDSSGIAQDTEMWADLLRILKPGGHLLAFSGSRTYHRMACAIEDAGFEIRDMIEWVYGSGFPKSLNIGKVTDKYLKTGNASWNGTGDSSNGALGYSKLQHKQGYRPNDYSNKHQTKSEITEEQAKQFEGYGTALKPAHEPCVLARKPIIGTVAQNALKYGTGGLAIDNCRVKPNGVIDEPSNPLLLAQRTVFSDKPELAPSSLDEIFSYSLDTLHDFFQHISSGQQAYNIVYTTPLRGVAFLQNTQNKLLLGVPCDYGQLVEHVKQYENQEYEVADFLNDYPTLHRLCDVYARQAKVPDQDVAPLLDDVLSYIRSVQQESLHSPDCSNQYLLLVLVVFAYDLLRSILPYDYTTSGTQSTGRFPANLITDGSDEVVGLFPDTKSGKMKQHIEGGIFNVFAKQYPRDVETIGDSGSASRFFMTCKPDLYCSLCYGIMEVCENNANNAQKTSQLGTQAKDTAQELVAEQQQQKPEDKNLKQTSLAHNAVSSSVNTNQTTANTVQPNATQNLKELSDLAAKYAESLCPKCQTSIAQKLVAMATENMALQVCQDFMHDYKSFTQTESLVSTVAYLANIDITQTTINLMKLCGFAHLATDENTKQANRENDNGIYRLKYQSKASKSERNAGLEGFPAVVRSDRAEHLDSGNMPQNRSNNPKANHHPTVKPLSLTKYLATLIKPPTGGRLLVPFSGSGSEMIGALQAGWEYVEGVELTEEYIPIAEARIKYWTNISH
jgi:DNA modification methylase